MSHSSSNSRDCFTGSDHKFKQENVVEIQDARPSCDAMVGALAGS